MEYPDLKKVLDKLDGKGGCVEGGQSMLIIDNFPEGLKTPTACKCNTCKHRLYAHTLALKIHCEFDYTIKEWE